MRARCAVCGHPRVAYVDRLVTAGNRSLKSIAAEVGVSYDALRKTHVPNHLPVAAAARGAAARGGGGGGVAPGASPLDVLRNNMDQLAAIDVTRLPASQRAQHLESVRRAAESLAKMEPPAAPTEVTLRDVRGLEEFLADVFLALEPHPEARRALRAVIEKHREALGG